MIKDAREQWDSAYQAGRTNDKMGLECLRFSLGKQWDGDLEEKRLKASRPCLVMNKTDEKVRGVENDFRLSRLGIKVSGVDSNSDPKMAEINAGLLRSIYYKSNATAIRNYAFSQLLRTGRGNWRAVFEYVNDRSFDQCVRLKRIVDPFSVQWDPFRLELDNSDANFCFIREELSETQFKLKYPKAELFSWIGSDTSQTNWRTQKSLFVAERFWVEIAMEKLYLVDRMDKERGVTARMAVTKLNPDLDVVVHKNDRPMVRDVENRQVWWQKMTGKEEIEERRRLPTKHIPVFEAYGREIWENNIRRIKGMVEDMMDPQRMYNYVSSSYAEQVALAPRMPWILTAKMLGEYQDDWDTMHEENLQYLLWEIDDANPNMKPFRESPGQISTAYEAALSRYDHDIMSASGRYQANLGERSNERSGAALARRQHMGDLGSYHYKDNMSIAMNYEANVVLEMARNVYDGERIERIIGEDDVEKQVLLNAARTPDQVQELQQAEAQGQGGPVVTHDELISKYLNDTSVGEFDVRVDVGPNYLTQRQESATMLTELMRNIPNLGLPMAHLLIKMLDMPHGDEAYKIARRMVPQGLLDPAPGDKPPAPDMKMELEKMKLQIEAFKTQAPHIEKITKAVLNIAKAMKTDKDIEDIDFQEILAMVEQSRTEEQGSATQAVG
tara:strand:+ start:992 stop:3001 length:2010 start_codon:yes stop_codon:yes gene_type:complete